jgi:RimJ/RimL family protein N-acetyltransferase
MSVTPILETERLLLRGHRPEDFQAMIAMWSHPEILQFIGDSTWSTEQIWSRLLRYPGHWQLMGYGYWAVEEKSTGKFIGELGFAEVQRKLEPSIVGFPELGWALTPEAHGKGYATEALKAAIKWGDKNLVEKRTVCIISPENIKSLRVAEKCGYHEVLRTTYALKPTVLFERITHTKTAE